MPLQLHRGKQQSCLRPIQHLRCPTPGTLRPGLEVHMQPDPSRVLRVQRIFLLMGRFLQEAPLCWGGGGCEMVQPNMDVATNNHSDLKVRPCKNPWKDLEVDHERPLVTNPIQPTSPPPPIVPRPPTHRARAPGHRSAQRLHRGDRLGGRVLRAGCFGRLGRWPGSGDERCERWTGFDLVLL